MFQDGYYADVWIHLNCSNTDKAKQWRQQRVSEDPGYNRYLRLISDGIRTPCTLCGDSDRLCVKAVDADWQMCCNRCHRVNLNGLNTYTTDDSRLYSELQTLRELFLHDSTAAAMSKIEKNMEFLAAQYDDFGKCECGGRYSISAKPRCSHCSEILFDSYFHFTAAEE